MVRALRNLAVKTGPMPLVYQELASNIQKTGYSYMIPDLRRKKRKEQGLPRLPKADLTSVQRLFEITGFSTTLEKEKTKNG